MTELRERLTGAPPLREVRPPTRSTLSLALDSAPWSPTFAGAVAGRFVQRCGFDDPARTTEFLVDHLVGHAVSSVGWQIEVEMIGDPRAVMVEVFDRGTAIPVPVRSRPTALSPAWLHVIAALADGWGCEAAADGKVVWFELTAPRSGCAGSALPLPTAS